MFLLVFHLMVSRGRDRETLKVLLNGAEHKLGRERLAEMLNMQTGKLNLGTVDIACKTNMDIRPTLRHYGAVEQQRAPDNWRPARRRSPPRRDPSAAASRQRTSAEWWEAGWNHGGGNRGSWQSGWWS